MIELHFYYRTTNYYYFSMLHPFILELHSCGLEPITGVMGISVETLLGLMPTIIKDLHRLLLEQDRLFGGVHVAQNPLKLDFVRSNNSYSEGVPIKVEYKNSWTHSKKSSNDARPLSSAGYLKLSGCTNENPWILDSALRQLSGRGKLLEGVLIRLLHHNEKDGDYWMSEIFNGVNIFGNEDVSFIDWEWKRYFQSIEGHPPTIKRFLIKTLARGKDPLSTEGSPRRPLYQDTTPLNLFLEKHDLRGLWSVDEVRSNLMEAIAASSEPLVRSVEKVVRRRMATLAPEEQEERLAKVKVIIDEIVRETRE